MADQQQLRRRLEKARKAKAQQRAAAQRKARRELQRVTPRWRDLISEYQRTTMVFGEESPEAKAAARKLRPVESRWIDAAMKADRLGVSLTA